MIDFLSLSVTIFQNEHKNRHSGTGYIEKKRVCSKPISITISIMIFCTMEQPFNAAAITDGHGDETSGYWGMTG